MHTLCHHLNSIAKHCTQINYHAVTHHIPDKRNNYCSAGFSLVASLGMVVGCSLGFQVSVLLGNHVSYHVYLVCYLLYYYFGWVSDYWLRNLDLILC